MAPNQLYIQFHVRPAVQELGEILIRNGAEPAGELGRMLDEILKLEEETDDLDGS